MADLVADDEERADDAAGGEASQSAAEKEREESESPRRRTKSKTPSPRGIVKVTPSTLTSKELYFHEAKELATLPRRRTSAFMHPAFWGFLAGLPSGVQSISDLKLKIPHQTLFFDLMLLAIPFGCFLFMVFSFFNMDSGKTSADLLNDLFEVPGNLLEGWRANVLQVVESALRATKRN